MTEPGGLCGLRVLIPVPGGSRPSVPPALLHSLGWGGAGRQSPGRFGALGGAADVAAGSGNPSQAAVPRRLLPQGEARPWPPATPAQLSPRPEEAPASLRLWSSRISGSHGRPPQPLLCRWLPRHLPLITGSRHLSADPAPGWLAVRREKRSGGPASSGSGRASWSLQTAAGF